LGNKKPPLNGGLVVEVSGYPVFSGVNPMSFALYLAGSVIDIKGLIYGVILIHMSTHGIVVGATVMLGLAILTGVKAARQKDSGGS
jgi:hypothetical protein